MLASTLTCIPGAYDLSRLWSFGGDGQLATSFSDQFEPSNGLLRLYFFASDAPCFSVSRDHQKYSSFATDGPVMKQKKDLQHKSETIIHHEDDWRIGNQLGN